MSYDRMRYSKIKFWSVNYWLTTVFMNLEFWTFIVLRETHVIKWSWWWLVGMQAMSVLSGLNAYAKIRRVVD